MFNHLLMLVNEAYDFPQFMLCKAVVAGNADFRLDPEFCLGMFPNHMDMHRFSTFLAEKEKPIRSNS